MKINETELAPITGIDDITSIGQMTYLISATPSQQHLGADLSQLNALNEYSIPVEMGDDNIAARYSPGAFSEEIGLGERTYKRHLPR